MVTPLGSRTCFGAPLGAFVVPVALTWLAPRNPGSPVPDTALPHTRIVRTRRTRGMEALTCSVRGVRQLTA